MKRKHNKTKTLQYIHITNINKRNHVCIAFKPGIFSRMLAYSLFFIPFSATPKKCFQGWYTQSLISHSKFKPIAYSLFLTRSRFENQEITVCHSLERMNKLNIGITESTHNKTYRGCLHIAYSLFLSRSLEKS